MPNRTRILLGQLIGLVWALTLIWLPQTLAAPFMPLNTVIILALLPGGLVAMAMVSVIALRRLFDDKVVLGGPLAHGTSADIDQRALSNTLEQLVLAAVLWPFVALTLGGLVVIWMGVAFALARLAFWFGYHRSVLIKSAGFGATFYPTLLATLWAVFKWAF